MKLIRKCKSNKMLYTKLVSAFIVIAMMSLTAVTVFAGINVVRVYDGGEIYTVRTVKTNISDILEENNIEVSEKDTVLPVEKLNSSNSITIRRAFPVTFIFEGKEKTVMTSKFTVDEFLKEQGVEVLSDDVITPSITEQLNENDVIKISRTTTEVVEEKAVISYTTSYVETTDLPYGKQRTKTAGVDGEALYTFEVVKTDGVEVSKKEVSRKVLKQAVNAVVEIGVSGRVAETSRGEQIRYKKAITVNASAYDLSYASCGKYPGQPGYGITASGMKAQYGVIAVDTRVIPLGTRLYVEAPDGSWSYGYCVAGDTGSAIKGNRIDLFFDSHSAAINFGRRTAVVYVLE